MESLRQGDGRGTLQQDLEGSNFTWSSHAFFVKFNFTLYIQLFINFHLFFCFHYNTFMFYLLTFCVCICECVRVLLFYGKRNKDSEKEKERERERKKENINIQLGSFSLLQHVSLIFLLLQVLLFFLSVTQTLVLCTVNCDGLRNALTTLHYNTTQYNIIQYTIMMRRRNTFYHYSPYITPLIKERNKPHDSSILCSDCLKYFLVFFDPNMYLIFLHPSIHQSIN